MKKIELLAERAKIVGIVSDSQYYTTGIMSNGFGCATGKDNIEEKELKENYENDKKLLKKLDTINNILFEADAKEYVEVLGNRLSIATARKYLNEFKENIWGDKETEDFADFLDLRDIERSGNLRAAMYSRCIIQSFDIVDKDPMNLKERRSEFKKKQLDWYYALKTAVVVSDATTEVEMIY